MENKSKDSLTKEKMQAMLNTDKGFTQDHNPKFELTKETLEKMNKEMIDTLSGKKKDAEKVKEGEEELREKLLQKRKDLEYSEAIDAVTRVKSPAMRKKVWKAFLKFEEPNFKEYMGYGKEEIEKIGIDKFIDTMDWCYKKEISSWRTDRIKIVICPECNEEFGIYPLNLGLCFKCQPKFLINDINASAEKMSTEDPELMQTSAELFFTDQKYRDSFKIKTINEYIDEVGEYGLKSLHAQKFILTAAETLKSNNPKADLNEFKVFLGKILKDANVTDIQKQKFKQFCQTTLLGIDPANWQLGIEQRIVSEMVSVVDVIEKIEAEQKPEG